MGITVMVPQPQVDLYPGGQVKPLPESVMREVPHCADWVLVTFAQGRVIRLWERNGSWDSDFYATYLTEDGEVRDFEYGSTRGWTYCNNAVVDATPEVMEAYAHILRTREVGARLARRKSIRDQRRDAALTPAQWNRLQRCLSPDEFKRVIKLLSTRLRSDFRKSMAAQIRVWLDDPSPQYPTPLSRRQMQYL